MRSLYALQNAFKWNNIRIGWTQLLAKSNTHNVCVCLSGCVSNVRNYFAQTKFSIENAFLLIPWNAKLSAVIPVRPFFKTWKMIFWLIMTRYRNKWKKNTWSFDCNRTAEIESMHLKNATVFLQRIFLGSFTILHIQNYILTKVLASSFDFESKFLMISFDFSIFRMIFLDSDNFDYHDFLWCSRDFHIHLMWNSYTPLSEGNKNDLDHILKMWSFTLWTA